MTRAKKQLSLKISHVRPSCPSGSKWTTSSTRRLGYAQRASAERGASPRKGGAGVVPVRLQARRPNQEGLAPLRKVDPGGASPPVHPNPRRIPDGRVGQAIAKPANLPATSVRRVSWEVSSPERVVNAPGLKNFYTMDTASKVRYISKFFPGRARRFLRHKRSRRARYVSETYLPSPARDER